MIQEEAWLDSEEWRELGESEAYLYRKLADSCGLDVNNRRDGEFLDFAYKLHVAPPNEPLPGRRRARNVELAHQGNIERGIRTLRAVMRAWLELRCPHRPRPTAKEVAKRASRLGKIDKPLSPRQASRLILRLRLSGDIA